VGALVAGGGGTVVVLVVVVVDVLVAVVVVFAGGSSTIGRTGAGPAGTEMANATARAATPTRTARIEDTTVGRMTRSECDRQRRPAE
jgi:hypothetical protein